MSSSNRTLWMGNIENWMSYDYLYDLLRVGEIFPKRIFVGCMMKFSTFHNVGFAEVTLFRHKK